MEHVCYRPEKDRERSELTEREPDPNKRTNKRNAEAGREGKAKGKEGKEGRKGRRERGKRSG